MMPYTLNKRICLDYLFVSAAAVAFFVTGQQGCLSALQAKLHRVVLAPEHSIKQVMQSALKCKLPSSTASSSPLLAILSWDARFSRIQNALLQRSIPTLTFMATMFWAAIRSSAWYSSAWLLAPAALGADALPATALARVASMRRESPKPSRDIARISAACFPVQAQSWVTPGSCRQRSHLASIGACLHLLASFASTSQCSKSAFLPWILAKVMRQCIPDVVR